MEFLQKISKIILLTIVLTGCTVSDETFCNLSEGFREPPQSARPQVWWHWMNGNVTEEGIRKDLEWFDRIGIGGVHIFDANFDTPQIVDKRLVYMEEDWKEAFRLAVRTADSLGIDVTIPSSPGFSSTGGPWVKPENAIKKLVWREFDVDGGKYFEGALPAPYTTTGKFQNYGQSTDEEYYEDIAVLAVRYPDGYRDLKELGAAVSSSGGQFDLDMLTDGDLSVSGKLPAGEDGFAWIQYEFPEPQTICALSVINANPRRSGHSVPSYCEDSLLISDDGIHFRTAFGIPVGDAIRQTISFEGITARYFRLKHRNPKAYYHYTMSHREPDPEYSEISEFVLYPQMRINHSEAKAAFAGSFDINLFPTPAASEKDIMSSAIDITEHFKDGILTWNIPDGRWKIYRFGASLTGKKNHPASPEATGLEVDKLDPEAWENHFRNYLDMNREAADGMLGRKGIGYVLIDSYEAGPQNWTPRLLEEFRERRGYDPVPWMPVLTGAIIGSSEESETFLFHWRKTIEDLFVENYSSLDNFIREEYGMKGCFIEAHANGRVFPADGMSMKKNAAYPMSEIWIQGPVGTRDRIPEAIADIRESSSVSNIYGQNLTAAESFTAIGVGKEAYTFCPENLKPYADVALAHGVNMFVIHDSAHQPLDSIKPGLGLGVYGQWFTRHETWAEQAGAWIDYLARSSFMMQQGKAVKDILWFYGEDNNVTGLYSHSFPDIPCGYDFDFASPDVLLNEVNVRNGRLRTKSGMEYSILCLDPGITVMSPEILDRINWFKDKGVTVCVGQEETTSALARLGVDQDWKYSGTDTLNFVHRRLADAEFYWISSPADENRKATVSLRTSGMKPYLWHPESGKIEEISYRTAKGRTELSLAFEPHDAYFIVFSGKTETEDLMVEGGSREELCTVEGEWDVVFRDPYGDCRTVTCDDLSSWSESDDEWIRHFSGTASYTKRITVPKHKGRVLIDLGSVKNIADVYVNGRKVETLWKRPFISDITDHLEGETVDVEVRVTNLWVNRLIGDAELEEGTGVTYTSKEFYTQEDQLKASGLLGPVRLLSEF